MKTGILIGGKWRDGEERFPVLNKYNGEDIAEIIHALDRDEDSVIAVAAEAASLMRNWPSPAWASALRCVSQDIAKEEMDLARTIPLGSGKVLK